MKKGQNFGLKLKLIHNDITEMIVDAIVLPANTRLAEGFGASAAIFEKAGRNHLKKACKRELDRFEKKHREIRVETAVAILAYNLNADFIVHGVVPQWADEKHDEYGMLSATYLSSLGLSDAMGCKSIAFPLLTVKLVVQS